MAQLLLLGAILLGPFSIAAFQGMAVPPPRAKPAKAIQTNLPPIKVNFRDVAEEAGLTAIHVSGGLATKKYILEATGSGVAIFDYDNDGLMDIFLVNASVLDPLPKEPAPTSHLYRNLGKLRFEDVTAQAGLDRSGWGQGACAADYDNDGYRDLFVTRYGHSALYRNQGAGKFTDVTAVAGLLAPAVRWDTGCSFFDYDLDGDLDLAITSYLVFDRAKIPEPGASGHCQWKGMPVMCGPLGLPPGTNHLYRNEGGGKFTDVSIASNFGKPAQCYGFTVAASDVDNDGYPDLYVACDSTPSLLYRNLRNGTFEEIGIASGAALNDDGREQAGMGVAVGDYDDDGDIDLIKTNFSDDVPNLYRNEGDGAFTDQAYPSGLGVNSQYLGWGAHLFDVDHDTRKEVLLVNGHVYPEVDRSPVGQKFKQARLLYWNVGGGHFKDISRESGPGIAEAWSSRGSAAGDLDNDGSLEVVVNNMGARPSLLKNFAPAKNWLLVDCVGTRSNRDGVGARVSLYFGNRRLLGEVQTGASFLSQNDRRIHFGVGDATRYDRIEVQWPGGPREVFPAGGTNRILVIREGSGRTPSAAPLR